MKYFRFSCINYNRNFVERNGSYYDYSTSFYSPDDLYHQMMTNELKFKGWRKIDNDNSSFDIFLKERHIIVINKL